MLFQLLNTINTYALTDVINIDYIVRFNWYDYNRLCETFSFNVSLQQPVREYVF